MIRTVWHIFLSLMVFASALVILPARVNAAPTAETAESAEEVQANYAKAEKTIIEGVTYFDIERDRQMREAVKKEKNELINLMLQDKNKGLKTQPVKKKEKQLLHCDSMDNEHIAHNHN